jgi:hypothetical protein
MGGVLAGRSPALLGLIEPKGRVSMMDFPSQKKKKKGQEYEQNTP